MTRTVPELFNLNQWKIVNWDMIVRCLSEMYHFQKWCHSQILSYSFLELNTGEAELRNIFWLVSWDHGSQKTFKAMLGDAVDIFLNTTSAVNQKFPQKFQLRQVSAKTPKLNNHLPHSFNKKIDMSTLLFQVGPFAAQMF